MNEYRLSTSVGQVVTKIEINIHAGKQNTMLSSYHKEGVFEHKSEIVFQTDGRIALSDNYITVLTRQLKGEKMQSYSSYLEQYRVSVNTKETLFPNGIFGYVYTIGSVKTAKRKLINAMNKKIKDEYGFLTQIDVNEFVLNND